jgi:uncharacterized GH25 family protein
MRFVTTLSAAGLALLLLSFGIAPRALAHDFWIEPTTFRPAKGEVVKLNLRVGEQFVGEPVKRNEAKIERFVVVGPGPGAKESPVLGPDGADPAGLVRADGKGIHVVGYRSRHSSITIEAAKFEGYLKEEGLERIIEARAKAGKSAEPGVEIYSRCAKTFFRTAGGDGTGYDRLLGFTLELVPVGNPFELKPGEKLPLRLLFEGKPLAGALVAAMNEKGPDARAEGRTDADGRVSLAFGQPGKWLVKSIHMVPVTGRDDAEWESVWASLTFEIGGASE